MIKPDVPANDLPFLPPDADIETKSLLRHAIAANRELARPKRILLAATKQDDILEYDRSQGGPFQLRDRKHRHDAR